MKLDLKSMTKEELVKKAVDLEIELCQDDTAYNDNILFFGKRTPDRTNFILVAISLDPHNAQEAHFELPLWEMGLPDHAETRGEDLMNGHRWTWYGKTQWMRIEPWQQPFGIWRISSDDMDPDLK